MHYDLDKTYILVYFFYGLAFFTMGISILQHRAEKGSTFPLLESIKFLGFFGLSHGITEWILMIIIARIYPENRGALYVIAAFINSLSFAFLFYFGIVLIEYDGKHKKLYHLVPWIAFTVWAGGFIYSLIFNNYFSDQLFLLTSLFSRYFIGLPGSILTAIALYRSNRVLRLLKLDKIVKRIKGAAISFLIYGFLAGVIVRKTYFFPSNIINTEMFFSITGLPVELARAIVAVVITVLSVTIIELFRWENEQKITRLTKQELINDERRRLCQNLHDVIIQNLFATGLKIEASLDEEDEKAFKDNLTDVKENLNDTILHIREYISRISIKSINIEGLKNKISDLVAELNNNSDIDIEVYYDIIDIAYSYNPSEKLTEIYFIIQEAISNAIKHSRATKIVVSLDINLKSIITTVFDNGIGFNMHSIQDNRGYGITAMNDRALSIGGNLTLKSDKHGTEIALVLPWRSK